MISEEAIEKGTGRSWTSWLDFFNSVGAQELTHQQIAERASSAGAPPWWGQMVTVAYEQHIGRRVLGQDCDGRFNVSASKTCEGTIDGTLDRWVAAVRDRHDFADVAITRGPEVSSTERWRYWRCGLDDGSRIVVMVSAKSPLKAVISVQHERLESSVAVEHWRAYWKSLLQEV
jgi:hypothetical protein